VFILPAQLFSNLNDDKDAPHCDLGEAVPSPPRRALSSQLSTFGLVSQQERLGSWGHWPQPLCASAFCHGSKITKNNLMEEKLFWLTVLRQIHLSLRVAGLTVGTVKYC
jgi:hypothetical protein